MARARTELIHCDNCGEDYAATYRRCPFCNAKSGQRSQEPYDDSAYDEGRPGGRRLAGGSRRGGGGNDPARIAIYALAIVVVLAVILFLLFKVIPGLMHSSPAPADTVQPPVESAAPAPSEEPDVIPSDAPTDDPLGLDSPDLPALNPDGTIASASPAQAPASQAPASQAPASQAPASQTPAGARLVANGRAVNEFSITAAYPDPVRLRVRDGEASTWHSRNESIATVTGNGTVTGVSNGYTTIDCTLTDGTKLSCTVHVSGKGGASSPSSDNASSAPASQAPSANGAKLTYAGAAISEFSITAAHPDPITLKVSGGTAASWSVRNSNVASVTNSGTVRAVGNGNTTVECKLDNGAVLTCTVHVSGF